MLPREELELLHWRISFIGYVIVAVLLVLGFGFWNAQVVQFGYYQQRAEQNRIREIPLPAPRGRIYDREHRILAEGVVMNAEALNRFRVEFIAEIHEIRRGR